MIVEGTAELVWGRKWRKMMKITVIHGQSHKGSTYNITQQIIDKISSENKQIDEYE